ncbi:MULTISPECIES: hypothetical protein [Cryobacterium]|nr:MULTISPECIES: hypothetical protein [Cryobacterium]TFD45802.1 hypothetical protein E3T33_06525 [Cryobacterium sp. TMT1-2-1]TFD85718.1 hypothetical protein E3T56_07680 [Cryobacterium psychrotolerans]
MTITIENRRAVEPDVALIGEELYVILSPTATMGFIHRAGNVYVASDGEDLGHALEVGQSLSWDEAVVMIQRSYESHH